MKTCGKGCFLQGATHRTFVSVPVLAQVVGQSGDCRDIILVSRVSHLNCRWKFRRQASVADSGVAL